jgi:serine/threonine protein kinase
MAQDSDIPELLDLMVEPLEPVVDEMIGKCFKGVYEIVSRIGEGGMGSVYLAIQSPLGRKVAVKVLRPGDDAAKNEHYFMREVQAINMLRHPNVINILDYGKEDDGTLYLVMEHLPGRTLRQLMRDEYPFDPIRICRIFIQMLGALEQAHQRGIVHCDLKPDNVMIEEVQGQGDFIKILDFGIAKFKGPAIEVGPHTQMGNLVGTFDYMSPEQIMGVEVDGRADVWSVGVMLYQMLTNERIFHHEDGMRILGRVMQMPIEPPSKFAPGAPIPAVLDKITLLALERNIEGRIASAAQMRAMLEAAIEELQGGARVVFENASAARVVVPELAAGNLFENKYRIVEVLHRTNVMTEVHARHEAMERDVILKFLSPEKIGAHQSALERFRKEIRLVSRLKSPHTATVFDFGEAGEGSPYMVVERIEGVSLEEMLLVASEPMKPRQAIRLCEQILKSLSEAHGLGVLHRDMSPTHVWIGTVAGKEQQVKVCDYAVAGLLEGRGRRGVYLSPEQIVGAPLKAASDLYGLGLMFYEMLTGRSLGNEEGGQVLTSADLAVLPGPLSEVVAKATAQKVSDRFASAEEFRQALEKCLKIAEARRRTASKDGLVAGPDRSSEWGMSAWLGPADTSQDLLPGKGALGRDESEIGPVVPRSSRPSQLERVGPRHTPVGLRTTGPATPVAAQLPRAATPVSLPGSSALPSPSAARPPAPSLSKPAQSSLSGELELDLDIVTSQRSRKTIAEPVDASADRLAVRKVEPVIEDGEAVSRQRLMAVSAVVFGLSYLVFFVASAPFYEHGFRVRILAGMAPIATAWVWTYIRGKEEEESGLLPRWLLPASRHLGVVGAALLVLLAMMPGDRVAQGFAEEFAWLFRYLPGFPFAPFEVVTDLIGDALAAVYRGIGKIRPW